MIIKNIENKDISNICEIHYRTFDKNHFTSLLSYKLLYRYYLMVNEINKYSVIIYDEKSSSVMGFVIGGNNIKKSINNFIRENYFRIIFELIQNPRFIWEKFLRFTSNILSNKNHSTEAKFRLLSIAVNPRFQSKGIGKLLLSEFEKLLIREKIYKYGLSVRYSNKNAIRFYISNGFKEEFRHVGNIYFIKNLINFLT